MQVHEPEQGNISHVSARRALEVSQSTPILNARGAELVPRVIDPIDLHLPFELSFTATRVSNLKPPAVVMSPLWTNLRLHSGSSLLATDC